MGITNSILQLCNGLSKHGLLLVSLTEKHARRNEIRIHLQRAVELFNGLIVTTSPVESFSNASADYEGERIELLSKLGLSNAFIEPTELRKMRAVPLMCQGRAWIELDGALGLFLRRLPVPVVESLDGG